MPTEIQTESIPEKSNSFQDTVQRIPLTNCAYLLHFPAQINTNESILIVPSSAGYCTVTEKYGCWSQYIDQFCLSLSTHYHMHYLVLPGQDEKSGNALYSYENSVKSSEEAIVLVRQTYNLIGSIGMCTGAAIAVEALQQLNIGNLPLVIYNTAVWVGWAHPKIQKMFNKKYPHVNLDYQGLLNAPMPGNIVPKHNGKILQILSGSSDYPLQSQKEMITKKPDIQQILFDSMSDVPLPTDEYDQLVNQILTFFVATK